MDIYTVRTNILESNHGVTIEAKLSVPNLQVNWKSL